MRRIDLPAHIVEHAILGTPNNSAPTEVTGTSLSGSDGDLNRTYDAGVVPMMIFVDGIFLHKDVDYSISGTTITFLNSIWNEMKIAIK